MDLQEQRADLASPVEQCRLSTTLTNSDPSSSTSYNYTSLHRQPVNTVQQQTQDVSAVCHFKSFTRQV